MDMRLAALEAALADPAQSGSLEGLILELSRCATEEAQAAADAVLGREQAVSADLRRALDAAEGRLAALASEKQAELRQVHDTFETKLSEQRRLLGDAERLAATHEASLADVRRDLDDERKHATDLRRMCDQTGEELTEARRRESAALAAQKALEADLVRERERTQSADRAHADARKTVQAEQATSLDLRKRIAELEQQAAAGTANAARTAAIRDAIERERDDARAEASGRRAELQTALGRIGALEKTIAEADHSKQRQESESQRNGAELAARLERASADLARERQQTAALQEARTALGTELDAARRAAVEHQREAADREKAIDQERQTSAAIRQAMEHERQAASTVRRELEQERQAAAALQARIDQMAAKVIAAGSDAERSESRFVALQGELTALHSERNTLEAERNALLDERSASERDQRAQHENRNAIAGERDAIEKDRDGLRTERTALQKELASARATEERLRADLDAARAEFERAEAARKLSGAAAERAAHEQTAAARKQLAAAQEESSAVSKQLAAVQAELSAARGQLAAAEGQAAGAKREAAEAAAARDEAIVELDRARAVAAALDDSRGAADAELLSNRTTVSDLRHDLEQAERRLLFEAGEKAQLLASYEEAGRQLAQAKARLEAMGTELQTSRVRLLEVDAPKRPVETPPAPHAAKAAKPAAARQAATPVPPAPRAPAPDDGGWVAVRMTTRYAFREHVDVQINGTPGHLVDLSTAGCQLLSPTALKPNQPVKVTLPAEPKSLSCSGKIVWATLEPPALGRPARYRVGVQFQKANEAAIQKFIDARSVS
jgi:chromosome segregation ATPase